MFIEIAIILSALIISMGILIGLRYIAWAINPGMKPREVARDLLGRTKKAEIIKTEDILDNILK